MSLHNPDDVVRQVVSSIGELSAVDQEIHTTEKYLRRILNLLSMSDGKKELEEYRIKLRKHKAQLETDLIALKEQRSLLDHFIEQSGFGQL